MALYWPEARVALEIVDDPASKPYEGPDDWTVLHVTCADIYDVHRFQKIGRELGGSSEKILHSWMTRCGNERTPSFMPSSREEFHLSASIVNE